MRRKIKGPKVNPASQYSAKPVGLAQVATPREVAVTQFVTIHIDCQERTTHVRITKEAQRPVY